MKIELAYIGRWSDELTSRTTTMMTT